MPRLLYWHVPHFGEEKFFLRGRRDDTGDGYGENTAQDRLNVLVRTITANDPHFVVIVGACPGSRTARGAVLNDDGPLRLLAHLRRKKSDWALVPPVISGLGTAREGIAVYFRRSDSLFFTGPWIWPGGAGPAGPQATPKVYPPPYASAFSQKDSDRTVPKGNNLNNPGLEERTLAGQYRYLTGAPPTPATFGSVNARAPFRTTFYDTDDKKNYTIIACHVTPGRYDRAGGSATAPSTLGTAAVGNLAEVQQVGRNETIVVVGDFNVNLFDEDATAVAYAPFVDHDYTNVVKTLSESTLPDGYPARGFLGTHIKPVAKATPASTCGNPAFGYMSVSDQDWTDDSVDNAFVRNGMLDNQTIANIVTGAPYKKPPTGVRPGTLDYPSALDNPATLNVPDGHDKTRKGYDEQEKSFRERQNYGLVHGVSDHLPIVFDF